MSGLLLKGINKVYPSGVQAVFNFCLDIRDKEFIVLVGPSGCGKSTTLRMIAGLEEISSGELYIDGKLVNDVVPKDRDIAMVFQNYALYPHMSVYDNMAFGLKLRKVPKEIIDQKVKAAAEILGITEYLSRKPKALSGGQRQRVALGRTIVREPKVFLLDEPLSNLDAKLRASMRTEISKLHARLATTFIYVTHDQIEAMTLADKICVLSPLRDDAESTLEQYGAPLELYHNPRNKFVAGFIGSPKMNFLDCVLVEVGERQCKVKLNSGEILTACVDARRSPVGTKVQLGIRPEHLVPIDHPDAMGRIQGEVMVAEHLGAESFVYMNVDDKDFTVQAAAELNVDTGDTLVVGVPPQACYLFDENDIAYPRTTTYNRS